MKGPYLPDLDLHDDTSQPYRVVRMALLDDH